MDTFFYAFHAVVPLLITMLIGYGFRRFGSWDAGFYKQLNRLCFRCFLPLYLFMSVYSIQDFRALNWPALLFLVCCILVTFLIGFTASHLLVHNRRQKGVMMQASFRSNQAVLGLPLATALGGEAAAGFAALTTAFGVPIFNTLAVIVLTVYSDREDKKISFRELVHRISRNPLIIAAMSGILLLLVEQAIQPVLFGSTVFTLRDNCNELYLALSNLSRVASPVMLFVMGTIINFSAVKGLFPQLCLGIFLRLLLCPLVVVGCAILLREPLGLTNVEFPAILSISTTPVAISSVVMTQEIGGDEQLAGHLAVWTSTLSMLTIFLFICAVRSLGVL